MGQVLVGGAATCTHDITYQYTCQHCSATVGPFLWQFSHSEELSTAKEGLEGGAPLCQLDADVLLALAQIRMVEEMAAVCRRSQAFMRDAYATPVFENHCPLCRRYQNWDTVRGLFGRKKPGSRHEWLLPVVDWRLEQLPHQMVEFFNKAVENEDDAMDAVAGLCFELLCVGLSSSLLHLVMGPTSFQARPFGGAPYSGAPDLREGELAHGYRVGREMYWVVEKEGRLLHIV